MTIAVKDRRLLLFNIPAWVLPGASVDLYFSQGLFFGGTPSSSLSVTRAQTVPSYATMASGLLVPFAANTPRITDQGLLVEEASTNTALQSRDMTQAAWVALNMTAAKNAVGADGVANSATTLTATAGNATILQALTIGSTAETYSVYLKRVSGTGTINISENGGSSWTACTINSTSFTRCSVEAVLANPSVGIQIVTNGDVVIADFNQNEAGAFATSPIPTTTVSVTRNADVVKLAGAALSIFNGSAYSARVQALASPNASGNVVQLYNGTDFLLYYNGTTTLHSFVSSGSHALNLNGVPNYTGGATKSLILLDASGKSITAGGVSPASDAFSFSSNATVYFGTQNGIAAWDAPFQRLTLWGNKLTAGQGQALGQ